MKTEDKPSDPFYITLMDIVHIASKSKKKIIIVATIFAILGLIYSLMKPINYQVKGSFRERSKSQAGIPNSLSSLLMLGGVNRMENEALSMMESRMLLEPLIKKMGLQVIVMQKEPWTWESLKRVRDNVKISYATLTNRLTPSIPDKKRDIAVSDVLYDGEIPTGYKVWFTSDDTFDVLSGSTVLGEGRVGTPFKTNSVKFTINPEDEKSLSHKEYKLVFLPMGKAFEVYTSKLNVEVDKLDSKLIKISYVHPDRKIAASFVNGVMDEYVNYLNVTHNKLSEEQLAYLNRKQKESKLQLEDLLEKHALSLSTDISKTGFPDSTLEMQFLATSLEKYKGQLLANDLEIKRLLNVCGSDCVFYDRYTESGDSAIINDILNQIRGLQQQRDAMDLALREGGNSDIAELERTFAAQLEELREIQQCSSDVKTILTSLDAKPIVMPAVKLSSDPRYLIGAWFEKIKKCKGQELANQKATFEAYLSNLDRMFGVHEKIIQERLTYQQNPKLEFQGITLATAQELFIGYSRQLNDIEANIRQNEFLVKQIEEPEFELSSLSNVLSDPVSRDMVSKAGTLVLALKDEGNRTSKEQDRIRQELDVQRKFLTMHLQQITQLHGLSENLIKEKIRSLREVMLELTYQQMSLLEKSLKDYVKARLANLDQEQQVVRSHIDEVHQQMSQLPKKWVGEQLIKQEMETNLQVVEELTKMVESKNVTQHLELIQSTPVDRAVLPLHPIQPKLFFNTILGALVGAFFSLSYLTLRAMIKGVQASSENLALLDQQVAGSLSKEFQADPTKPLRDSDLATLRRLMALLEASASEHGTALFVEGRGSHYASALTNLMALRGKKVLLLPLSFDRPEDTGEGPGLLQYLQGQAEFPRICRNGNFDAISPGGICRYGIELLCSPRFPTLFNTLKDKYDWIFAYTHSESSSAETESLVPIFSHVIVSVSDETVPELKFYLDLSNSGSQNVSFIFT